MQAEMTEIRSASPSRRDRAIRRVRTATWAIGAATVGLAASLSAVAANAFKGNSRQDKSADAAVPKDLAPRRVVVPPPEHVPAIAAGQAPLTPPASPPSAAPSTPPPAAPATPAPAPSPAPVPQPQTSGGS
jgi:hypothetical protein